MAAVLAFWAVSLLIGLLALPIAFALLRRLPNAGAALAIPLGLVLTGYVYFILRIVGVLPFGRGGYILAIALLGIGACAVIGRDRRFRATWRRTWPSLIVVAGVFTLLFFGYTAFRSYNAGINGTEQPMDLMYLDATLHSKDFPPKDSWLDGHSASYYYFGYLQIGVLTSAAGVSASTGYNLGLAYTFAAAGTAIASLGYAFARWAMGTRGRKWAVGAGAVAVGLLLFVGSLSAIFEWAASHEYYNRGLYDRFGVEWLIPCTPQRDYDCYSGATNPRTTEWYPTEYWFWWRGSRIIPGTITEFPFFSFLLGDLHPHVMSIPLVLLTLGVSGALWRGRKPLRWRTHLRSPALTVLLGVVFGALAFQNAWDILTFTAVLVVAVFARNWRSLPIGQALGGAAGFLAPVFLAAILAYAPWYADFRSQASGIYPYVGVGTRPAHAFLQFGPLLFAAGLALTWAFRRSSLRRLGDIALGTAWVPMLPFALWIILALYHGTFGDAVEARGDGGVGGWVTLIGYGGAAWALSTAAVALAFERRAAAVAVAVAALGALLLYGAELFLIRDIFFSSEPRLNTVFKLSYQAWIVLSLGGAVALVAALRAAWLRRAPAGWLAVPVGLVVIGGLVYPLTATPNRTEGFTADTAIDGLQWVARNDPDEYALTRWVQAHTVPGDTVIEASGRTWRRNSEGKAMMTDANVDYTEAGRISARTGSTMPIGWYFHEVQWRGDTPSNVQLFTARQDLIDSVYTQKDPAAVMESLRTAGARYVVVSHLEQSKYDASLMPDFGQFLDVAFESGNVRVYEVPQYRAVATS